MPLVKLPSSSYVQFRATTWRLMTMYNEIWVLLHLHIGALLLLAADAALTVNSGP